MDRIGAIKEAMRREICSVSLPAPVSFWNRVRLSLLFFGLICFLSGFAVGKAQAAPAGEVKYIIQCQFIGTTGNSVGPCVTVGINRHRPVMVSAYVIDPNSASYIDALTTPFNYSLGGAFWAFGFVGVMILYFSSHIIGLVLKAVKNG